MSEFTVSEEVVERLAATLYESSPHVRGEWENVKRMRTVGALHAVEGFRYQAAWLLGEGWVPAAEYRDYRITELEAEVSAAERDYESLANDHTDLNERHGLLWDERDAVLAVIEKAPHPDNCLTMQNWRAVCNCWKSSVGTSALAEHDAEREALQIEALSHGRILDDVSADAELERTATTEEVRQVYTYSESRAWASIRKLGFNRWLAERDAETRQKALGAVSAFIDSGEYSGFTLPEALREVERRIDRALAEEGADLG